MEFEWNALKAATNLEKHKVAFEDAIDVFDDPNAFADPAKVVDGEDRFKTTGYAGGALLTVIYARRDADEEVCRLISARPASRRERRDYGNR